MSDGQISDQEFAAFQKLIYEIAGISLSEAKRVLLVGRLTRRLRHFGFDSFGAYYRHVRAPENAVELQTMVDLLTTNETYFFREPQHFEFLRQQVLAAHPAGVPFRIWSGASSSGEEAYTMAMVLAETLGDAPWEVFGSDISLSVLARAQAGVYPLERAEDIPQAMLKRYCLKGVRSQAGMLLIAPELRARVRFAQLNLTQAIRGIGQFDVIFLRNVMIYFDNATKRKVVANMLPQLKSSGYFVVGHSESLNGIADGLKSLRPTVYCREVAHASAVA